MSGIDVAVALIVRPDFEGLRLEPYLCPGGYWTIGYGARFLPGGQPVTARTGPITAVQARHILRQNLETLLGQLRALVSVPLTSFQLGALLSWQFNIGTQAARSSTLIRLLNLGKYEEAAAQFAVWNKATVKGNLVSLPGLTRRRRVGADVFRGLVEAAFVDPPAT